MVGSLKFRIFKAILNKDFEIYDTIVYQEISNDQHYNVLKQISKFIGISDFDNLAGHIIDNKIMNFDFTDKLEFYNKIEFKN